ncbi:MAG TPA: RNA 2',3'-cyclic phosphodiesterase [Selenomonadales bacterium]|nr:RNA 2',3'-cyclic phosphodiesterase [Selenomonadales bacterium]
MRLFVGIEFPPAAEAALAKCQDDLRRRAERGRFKSRENFHLTLQFLGEVPEDGIARLRQALKEAAGGGPFTLRLGRLGQFGQDNPVRVVWVDVGGDAERLQALQARVRQVLAGAGFPAERRRWQPHITLAQDVLFAGKTPAWSEIPVDPVPFAVTEFTLLLSEERERRRVYTPLYRFSLREDA